MNEFLLGQEVTYWYEDLRGGVDKYKFVPEARGIVVAVAFNNNHGRFELLIRDLETNKLESCSHYAVTINPS